MTAPTAEAQTIPCPHCGARFGIERLTAEISCPFCTRAFSLPAETLQRLGAYQHTVGANLGAAANEQAGTAIWKATQSEAYSRQQMTFTLVVLGAGGVFAVLASGAVPIDPDLLFGIVPVAVLAFVGYALWWSATFSRTEQRTIAAEMTVVCSACAGPNAIFAGQVVDTCRFCGAALVPGPAIVARGIDQAHQQLTRSRIARFRTERSGMLNMMGGGSSKASTSGRTDMWTLILLLPLTGMLVYFATIGSDATSGPQPPPAVQALSGLFFLAHLGAVLWTYTRRRTRTAGLREAHHLVAAQFGGQPHDALATTIAWLNNYWAGPYDVHNIIPSPFYDGLTATVHGYPVLVDSSPAGAAGRRPRVHVMVGAWVPGVSDESGRGPQWTQAAHAEVNELQRLGFSVEPQVAGLVAIASKETLRTCLKKPETLHGLADVIHHAARLAHELQAQPAARLA